MDPFDRHAAWFEQLLGRTRDHALLLLDASGAIIEWLGASSRLFGYERDEVLGRPFAMLFVPDDRALQIDRQEMAVAAASGRSEDDRWHQRKDGSLFWASGVLEAVRDDAGGVVGYAKLLRDRTDLRTRVEALEDRVASLGAQLARHDESPVAGVGPIPIEPRPVVLQQAVRAALGAVEPTARRKRQRIELLAPAEPLTIEADPARLQQMLLHLLGNAVKYTGEDGHVVVTASIEASDAVVRVEDDGIGIPSDMYARIFELFTREPGTRRTMPDGLGVGLAMVRTLAARHGGTIEARSAGPGLGSVFALRLPLRGPAPAA